MIPNILTAGFNGWSALLRVVRVICVVTMTDQKASMPICKPFKQMPVMIRISGVERYCVRSYIGDLKVVCVD